jgi:hypothetical protein
MPQTNSFATRLGADGFALQMQRYQGPADRHLWILSVAQHPADTTPAVQMVATTAAMLDLRRIADEALAALKTDGGRLGAEEAVPSHGR